MQSILNIKIVICALKYMQKLCIKIVHKYYTGTTKFKAITLP